MGRLVLAVRTFGAIFVFGLLLDALAYSFIYPDNPFLCRMFLLLALAAVLARKIWNPLQDAVPKPETGAGQGLAQKVRHGYGFWVIAYPFLLGPLITLLAHETTKWRMPLAQGDLVVAFAMVCGCSVEGLLLQLLLSDLRRRDRT